LFVHGWPVDLAKGNFGKVILDARRSKLLVSWNGFDYGRTSGIFLHLLWPWLDAGESFSHNPPFRRFRRSPPKHDRNYAIPAFVEQRARLPGFITKFEIRTDSNLFSKTSHSHVSAPF
jgi:hypothetical protein